jgi:hypothetical protein
MTPYAIALTAALYVAHALGFKSPDPGILDAAVVACHADVACSVDASYYAAKESGYQRHPKAVSWDARAGISRGPWQLWNCKTDDVYAQARDWKFRRDVSLKRWGDLRGLAGNTSAGRALTVVRRQEIRQLDTEFRLALSAR